MGLQRLGHRADGGRQHADEVGMALGEAQPGPAGGRAGPHRQPLLLGQGDGGVPAAGGVDVRPSDHHRRQRAGQALGHVGQRGLVGGGAPDHPAGDGGCAAIRVGLGVPVVHGDGDERRALGGQHRVVNGTGDRARDVLGARGLVAPFHIGLGADGGIAVGEVGLDGDLGPDLLAGGDHQRRLVGLGVEDPADGVAHARGGVEVDVRGAAAGLREPVGHTHHHQFLEAEHVGEIVGEVGEHRQLGRAWVAEDRRHAVGPEQVERRFTNACHRTSSCWSGWTVCRPRVARAPRRRRACPPAPPRPCSRSRRWPSRSRPSGCAPPGPAAPGRTRASPPAA